MMSTQYENCAHNRGRTRQAEGSWVWALIQIPPRATLKKQDQEIQADGDDEVMPISPVNPPPGED